MVDVYMTQFIELLVANSETRRANTPSHIQFKLNEVFNSGLYRCFMDKFKNNTKNTYSQVVYDSIAMPVVVDMLLDNGFDVQGDFSIITKCDPEFWWKPETK